MTLLIILLYSERKMDATRKFLHASYPKPEAKPTPVVFPQLPTAHRVADGVCERERDFATDIGYVDDPTRVYHAQTQAERQIHETLRTEAYMHAKMRNMHFRLATQAFIAGNGAVAKRHSDLGKQHDRMMRDLDSSAAQKIIQIRNPHFCSFRGTNENVLDLHGLKVREAIDFLTGIFINTKSYHGLFLTELSLCPPIIVLTCLLSFQTDRTFFVICGAGQHNPEHMTPLADAVRRYLEDNNFRYSDCSADKRGGMLRVKIPRSVC